MTFQHCQFRLTGQFLKQRWNPHMLHHNLSLNAAVSHCTRAGEYSCCKDQQGQLTPITVSFLSCFRSQNWQWDELSSRITKAPQAVCRPRKTIKVSFVEWGARQFLSKACLLCLTYTSTSSYLMWPAQRLLSNYLASRLAFSRHY